MNGSCRVDKRILKSSQQRHIIEGSIKYSIYQHILSIKLMYMNDTESLNQYEIN